MNVLIVGGGGYIGSHMVKLLGEMGIAVTILDDFSSGYRDAILYGNIVQGNTSNQPLLYELLGQGFDAVMHFASSIQVGESIIRPDWYYQNNFGNTLNLLNAMHRNGVKRLIFSSTAACFGDPSYIPIDEKHPRHPINPYGRSKLMVEEALLDYDRAFGIKSISLRYFNAAGADPDGRLGERHNPETHLIPLLLQFASGRRESISVFGRDYDTPDGTCIRDYVHVSDLCVAHWLALSSLMSGSETAAYNLGNGVGFSVQEVIENARCITGRRILVKDEPKRKGDPARLVADSTLAKKELGWVLRHSDLTTIIKHAWNWERKSHFL